MKIDSSMQPGLESLCAALKDVDVSKLAGENVSGVQITTNDKGLTISFDMMVDGAKVPVVLSASPELEVPDGSADAEALGVLIDKLGALDTTGMSAEEAEQFMKDVIESVVAKIQAKGGLESPSAPSTTGGATLFNLLEILSLLVEAGQEMKKVAKEIKASDNNLQAQSYEQQADKTVAMAESAKSLNQKYTIISACMMVASAAVSIGAGIGGAVRGNFADTKANGVAANMAKNVMTEPTPAAQGADPIVIATKDGVKAQAAIGNDRVDAIKNDFANSPEIAAARNGYQTALQQHGAGSPEAAEAKSAYIEAVLNVKGKYDTAYIGNPDSPQAKAEMTVANEFAMRTLKNDTVSIPGQGEGAAPVQEKVLNSSDFGRLRGGFEKTYRKSLADENHYLFAALASVGTLAGQGGQIIQQAGQSDVNYKAQSEQADATRMQADATRKQNDYEDDKSLENSAQEIIDAALQTLEKTYESQRQSTREIFG